MLFISYCVSGQQLWVLISHVMTYSLKACQPLFMSSEPLQSMFSHRCSKPSIMKTFLLFRNCKMPFGTAAWWSGIDSNDYININPGVCHLFVIFWLGKSVINDPLRNSRLQLVFPVGVVALLWEPVLFHRNQLFSLWEVQCRRGPVDAAYWWSWQRLWVVKVQCSWSYYTVPGRFWKKNQYPESR